MAKGNKASLYLVTFTSLLLYVGWVVYAFTMDAPLGVPRAFESVESLGEIIALASLPVGLFSAVGLGLASWAVVLQHKAHRLAEMQNELAMTAPIMDKCEQVLNHIDAVRVEMEKARKLHLTEMLKHRRVANEIASSNRFGVFDISDPASSLQRLPHRLLEKALSMDASFDPNSDHVYRPLRAENVARVLDEMNRLRKAMDAGSRHERLNHLFDTAIRKLDGYTTRMRGIQDYYHWRLQDNKSTTDDEAQGDAAEKGCTTKAGNEKQPKSNTTAPWPKGWNADTSLAKTILEAYKQSRGIMSAVDNLRLRMERAGNFDPDNLRGYDSELYLWIIQSSKHLQSAFDEHDKKPVLNFGTRHEASAGKVKVHNYNRLQDGFDSRLKKAFEAIIEEYPGIVSDCNDAAKEILLALFKPRGTNDARRIVSSVNSPFFLHDAVQAARKARGARV